MDEFEKSKYLRHLKDSLWFQKQRLIALKRNCDLLHDEATLNEIYQCKNYIKACELQIEIAIHLDELLARFGDQSIKDV